jgi:TPR repeat protein
MLEKGIGFSKDEAEAVKWYRKAAEQENARSQSNAQSMLGLMYADGRGVAKDNSEAMRWFGKVMKKRYAEILSESDPVITIDLRFAKDETEVMERYRSEAESGSARAQSILGDMYSKGFGVSKDEVEAFKWYSKAAEATDQGGFGGRGAPYNLGFLYAEGRGVAKDEAVAIKWYRKAAEQEAVGLETIIRMSYKYGPF